MTKEVCCTGTKNFFSSPHRSHDVAKFSCFFSEKSLTAC
ncbi:hypothetical protein PRUPE_3G156100 [Prunus persica]|uniref:Uncharacterized protein n=1 Tax=Prunus persica TaxID=3760 RepID=A0A251Q0V0_PRUPE|nr:hypothetical protein PRUPE_3G156100 [Prunus persica]